MICSITIGSLAICTGTHEHSTHMCAHPYRKSSTKMQLGFLITEPWKIEVEPRRQEDHGWESKVDAGCLGRCYVE